MTFVIDAISVGAGVPSRDATGEVVGTFGHGVYVQMDEWLFAVGALPRGPIHVETASALRAQVGARVTVTTGEALVVGGVVVKLSSAAPWAPQLPNPGQAEVVGRVLAAMDDTWPSELPRVTSLPVAAVRLGGRGSGLTPAGDDVIAGMLLADRVLYPAKRGREDLLENLATTDLSLMFLRWAARGQSIEPVHDLLAAAAAADHDAARLAADRLLRIGASSGAALLAGLTRHLLISLRNERRGDRASAQGTASPIGAVPIVQLRPRRVVR